MPNNPSPEIAALPLYQLGFHDGQDVGLRIALDAITRERIRREQLKDAHPDSTSPAASRHDFAAGACST